MCVKSFGDGASRHGRGSWSTADAPAAGNPAWLPAGVGDGIMPARMRRRFLHLLLFLALPASASPEDIVKQERAVTITVDPGRAFPGGLLVVRLHSRRRLGMGWAILDGRRAAFYTSARGPQALVPVPVTALSGTSTLGVEVRVGRRRRRVLLEVPIAPRSYPAWEVLIPEALRPLLEHPSAVRDGRRLLPLLRTETPAPRWSGPLRPPVEGVEGANFGGIQTYVGGSPVESMMDAVHGEYHRGLDYAVPPGTPVLAPAAGTVLLAAPLTLTGETLVLDHGQGVVSVFFHLGRVDVREGDRVEGRAAVGLSGATGLALSPHVHWGVYVHGVAVDPRVLKTVTE